MNYYQEVTIIKNSEIDLSFLRNKIITKIHQQLITLQNNDGTVGIGISFPEFSKEHRNIGTKIRVFAQTKEELEGLNILKSLHVFSDYMHCTRIRSVPSQGTEWVTFVRRHIKASPSQLARRYAKRKNISIEEALLLYEHLKESFLDLPYLHLKSSSNNNTYKYYIDMIKVEKDDSNKFNTFGLSLGGTVPFF